MKLTKLKVNINRSAATEKIRQKVMDEVIASGPGQKFIKEYDLNTEIIDNNLGVMKRMVDDLNICEPCTSYYTCPKDVKGYQIRLDTSSGKFFEVEYVKCSKLLDYEKVANHYIYKHFKDSWIDNRLNKITANNYRSGLVKLATDLLAGRINSLFIYGQGGLGKTFICSAIANDFIEINEGKIAFVNAHTLVEELRTMIYDDKVLFLQKIKDLEMVDLLIIDDLGNEKITDWSKEEVIFPLIETRLRNNKPLIINSDYAFNELKSLYAKESLKSKKMLERFENSIKQFQLLGVVPK
jgi:primosomal protein DnaI